MPLIDYPDVAELDDGTRELLEKMSNDRNEIPSFPHMLANNPAILEATPGQFFEVIYGGDLDPELKQLAFVVVSQENECPYCAASHGDELVNDLGVPDTHLDAIAERDYGRFTDRRRAVAEFARHGASDPKRITADHVAALREVGFNEADVIELLTVVAQAAFANTIADALNIHPSDQSRVLEQFYTTRLASPG